MVLKVTYTLQSKCKTCFGGPRMVLQAHLKKHIIALGGWLLMYTSGPPPGLANDHTFSDFFFCYLPLEPSKGYPAPPLQEI